MNLPTVSFLAATTLACTLAAQNPTGCTITRVGDGCGPTLTVTLTPSGNGAKRLVIEGTGLLPQTHCGFIFGVEPITPVPIAPGSLCLLYTDYVWGHQLRSDRNGNVRWNRSWPNSFQGWFYIQMGSVTIDAQGNTLLNVTNCELVDCRPQ